MKSDEWQQKRITALRKANYECQRCGSKESLDVHHKNYSSLYRERLNDIAVLCRRCHPSADSKREYETAYETYAYKKYGEDWWKHDSEWLEDQFDEWYEGKLEEED